MIVTCASCLTKFNLDESKIPAKGAKVRCSRCQHVFYVTPPPVTKEEIEEDFESFAKYHEELIEPTQKEVERPPQVKEEEKKEELEEEKKALFAEEAKKVEEEFPEKPFKEERVEEEFFKPKRVAKMERRRPSLFFVILVVLIIAIFGLFYLWTESGESSKVYSLLEYPIKMVTHLWEQIWGSEKEGLIVRDLNGYDERIGEVPLFIIEGKVNNQSRYTKKHIKIKVAIFDQKKAKLAEKETICGRSMSREELKNLPETFFKGAMFIRPKTEKDMVTAPGKTSPFIIIFKNLPSQAKEFQVEIVEAPNL